MMISGPCVVARAGLAAFRISVSALPDSLSVCQGAASSGYDCDAGDTAHGRCICSHDFQIDAVRK